MAPELREPRNRLVVGNDVVDLEDPRCGDKHLDERFLARVFAPEERDEISSAADPAHALWLRWAAKEAAYKVVTKLCGAPPPFTHAAFVVDASGDGGVVRYDSYRVPFKVARRTAPLHVIALDPELGAWSRPDDPPSVARRWSTGPRARLAVGVAPLPASALGSRPAPLDDSLSTRFTGLELQAIQTLPSALVRLEARAELARVLSVEERRLQIVCAVGSPGRSPPSVLLDGHTTDADVSLSHHGGWVGWSILVLGATGRQDGS